MFKILSPQSDQLSYLVISGQPYAKIRPRYTKKGYVYNSEKQKINDQHLALEFKSAFPKPFAKNLAVGCIFYRSNKQRIDVDNMLKNVMDAANGIIFIDDCQVTAKFGIVELDKENPRTIIIVGEHESTLERDLSLTIKCNRCGNDFDVSSPFFNKRAKYCSRECASLSRGEDLREEIKCPICGDMFRRRNFRQMYCAEKCRIVNQVKRNEEKRKHEKAFCKKCGVPLSRPEYVHCRSCWVNKNKDPQKEGDDS